MSTPSMADAKATSIECFEDLRLGQRFSGGDREVTDADLANFTSISGDRHPLHTDPAYAQAQGYDKPLLQGPFGLAAFFGWFFELGLARPSIVGLLDTNWRYLRPLHVGDRIRFEMTITRLRRTSTGERGVVGRNVRMIDANGATIQEGTSSVLVRARGPGRAVGQELFSKLWAQALAARLNANERFRAATATWDGTLGLAADDEETPLRIYRGQVIEAGARTPQGSTFTVGASALTWAEMITAARNDYMIRAMQGAFSIRGNAYEYLRLTKAVSLLVDSARELFEAEGLR